MATSRSFDVTYTMTIQISISSKGFQLRTSVASTKHIPRSSRVRRLGTQTTTAKKLQMQKRNYGTTSLYILPWEAIHALTDVARPAHHNQAFQSTRASTTQPNLTATYQTERKINTYSRVKTIYIDKHVLVIFTLSDES